MTGFEGHSEKVSAFSQVVYMLCQMCHIIIMVPGKDIIERCTCFSKRQKITVSCGNFSQYMHWEGRSILFYGQSFSLNIPLLRTEGVSLDGPKIHFKFAKCAFGCL
jgi:hypothetical protein